MTICSGQKSQHFSAYFCLFVPICLILPIPLFLLQNWRTEAAAIAAFWVACSTISNPFSDRFGYDQIRAMQDKKELLHGICSSFPIDALYVFGSRAQEVTDELAGEEVSVSKLKSDVDIGVQVRRRARLTPDEQRVDLWQSSWRICWR